MRKVLVGILSAGHLFTDMNQGALPALLPFFIAAHHFSYATAAGLVSVANLTSCIVQPVFGQIADQFPAPWLVPVGIVVAGFGVALTTVLPSYGLMLLAIAISGLGLAAFHPEGARLVNYVSGDRKATAMSLFSVGGTTGFALGALLAAVCVTWLGIHGEMLLMVPACVISGIIYLRLRDFRRKATVPGTNLNGENTEAWLPFGLLTGAVVCRSIVFFGLNTFLALYWTAQLHQSRSAGATALTVLLFSGAVGTVLGGLLADRFGQTRVVVVSLWFIVVLLSFFLAIQNAHIAMVLLAPLGIMLFAPFSVMVVIGQRYLPNRLGVASGVTLGLAGSIGGVATPFFGYIADHRGLHTALVALIVVAISAGILGLITARLETPEYQSEAVPATAQ